MNRKFRTQVEKPPIGLMPEKLFDEEIDKMINARIFEILQAMERYSKEEKIIPLEWIYELNKRIQEKHSLTK